jgi:hypothetical protein
MTTSVPKDRKQAAQELLKRAQERRRDNQVSGKKMQPIMEPRGSMGQVLSQDKFKIGPKLEEWLLDPDSPVKPGQV